MLHGKLAEEKEAYIIILSVIIALSIVAFSLYQSVYGSNYQQALKSQSSGDICVAPPGYTDEQWREHMSHHPEQYKECLRGSK